MAEPEKARPLTQVGGDTAIERSLQVWAPSVFAYAVVTALLSLPLYQYVRARRARRWPKAAGTVLRVSTDYDEGTTSIVVEYEYGVNGEVLRGRRIRFGAGPYYRQKTVAALVNRYPRGAVVEVLYDPSNPRLSVLEPTFEWLGFAPFVLLALSILVPWTWHLLTGSEW